MKQYYQIILLGVAMLCLVIPLVLSDDISLIVIPLNSSQGIKVSSDFDYVFNFSNSVECSTVLLSNHSVITTDNYGRGLVRIDLTSLTSVPNYICEYRNLTWRANHTFQSGIFNRVIANSTLFNNIYSNSWTNVSITYQQVQNFNQSAINIINNTIRKGRNCTTAETYKGIDDNLTLICQTALGDMSAVNVNGGDLYNGSTSGAAAINFNNTRYVLRNGSNTLTGNWVNTNYNITVKGIFLDYWGNFSGRHNQIIDFNSTARDFVNSTWIQNAVDSPCPSGQFVANFTENLTLVCGTVPGSSGNTSLEMIAAVNNSASYLFESNRSVYWNGTLIRYNKTQFRDDLGTLSILSSWLDEIYATNTNLSFYYNKSDSALQFANSSTLPFVVGNWTANQSLYYNKSISNSTYVLRDYLVSMVGNWTANETSYYNKSISNSTYVLRDYLVSMVGNYSANQSFYYNKSDSAAQFANKSDTPTGSGFINNLTYWTNSTNIGVTSINVTGQNMNVPGNVTINGLNIVKLNSTHHRIYVG